MEIRIIINERPRGTQKYRATPEQIERNRKEIREQEERDQRAREKAYPNSSTDATQDRSTHQS